MSEALVGIIPAVLWIVFAGVVFLTLRRPIESQLRRLTGAKVAGFEVTLASEGLAEAAKKQGVELSVGDRRSAAERAAANHHLLDRARILWLDDAPGNNRRERRIMARFGAQFSLAETLEEALNRLGQDDFDVVITNYGKHYDPPHGPMLAKEIHNRGLGVPIVMYTTGIDEYFHETPKGILAVTTRPDRLLHFVLDALEHG